MDSLKAAEIKGRLERLQREQGLADQTTAIRAYYRQHVKDAILPKTEDEQLALLRQREPVPVGPVEALLKSRMDGTRERLLKAEGIPAGRLSAAVPAPAAAAASATSEGRVEFSIAASGG